MPFLTETLIQLLENPDYWNKCYTEWGIRDWDEYYKKKFPGHTIRDSHRVLAKELHDIIGHLPAENHGKQKALMLWKDIESHIESLSQPAVGDVSTKSPKFIRKRTHANNIQKPKAYETKKRTRIILDADESNPQSNNECEDIIIDFTKIAEEYEKTPKNKWLVNDIHDINVTDRFRKYQKDVLKKAYTEGLTYSNYFEVLALWSIIVLTSPCPYPNNFTKHEWNKIISQNPYVNVSSPLTDDIALSVCNASAQYLQGKNVTLPTINSEAGAITLQIIINMWKSLPDIAPVKLSEAKHCFMYLDPILRPLFCDSEKGYALGIDSSTKNTRKRPDYSCITNGIPVMNSEVKPLGFKPLDEKKDKLKVQLRARKAINQLVASKGGPSKALMFTSIGDLVESHIMDLEYDGLYRSWPLLTTRLAKDKPTLPLLESNIRHFFTLEKLANTLCEDYNNRSVDFTPSESRQYMRELPNSQQLKDLLDNKVTQHTEFNKF